MRWEHCTLENAEKYVLFLPWKPFSFLVIFSPEFPFCFDYSMGKGECCSSMETARQSIKYHSSMTFILSYMCVQWTVHARIWQLCSQCLSCLFHTVMEIVITCQGYIYAKKYVHTKCIEIKTKSKTLINGIVWLCETIIVLITSFVGI